MYVMLRGTDLEIMMIHIVNILKHTISEDKYINVFKSKRYIPRLVLV